MSYRRKWFLLSATLIFLVCADFSEGASNLCQPVPARYTITCFDYTGEADPFSLIAVFNCSHIEVRRPELIFANSFEDPC